MRHFQYPVNNDSNSLTFKLKDQSYLFCKSSLEMNNMATLLSECFDEHYLNFFISSNQRITVTP